MTPHNRAPVLWFMTPVDLRHLAGDVIFHRGGGGNVSLPAFDIEADEGIYEDAIVLANGRGSSAESATLAHRRDMTSDAEGQHPDGVGEFGFRITAGNCVQIWSSAAFDLEASADNAIFGLPVGATAAALDLSGEYRITGTHDWERGPVVDAFITIDPGAAPDFRVPRYATAAQGVVELIRRRGREAPINGAGSDAGPYDIDDTHSADCLEALDNAVNDASLRRIRWYVDATGHMCSAWPTSIALAAPTFDSAAFRTRIGATGVLPSDSQVTGDAITTAGDLTIWRAGRPMPGLATTSRPWIRRPREIRGERTESARKLGGGAASHGIDDWVDIEFEFWLDGPESPHTPDDLGKHWSRQVLRYCPVGAPLTVYVGQDGRRHIEEDDVSADVPAFSELYCADPCGGRYAGWDRSTDDPEQVVVEYDEDEQGGWYWAQVKVRISPPQREEE
jgi:hypothetical protein